MSQYRLRAIDSYEPLASYFQGGPEGGLKLKEMVLSNDSTELLYWPHDNFLQTERNKHFWLKQWKRTQDPVESHASDKYKDQPPTVDHPAFAAFKVGEIVKEIPDVVHFDITSDGEGTGEAKFFDASAAFKLLPDFSNFVECFNELVEKNYEFSTSRFPERIMTCLEVRFIKASRKLMSFVYDAQADEEEVVFCVINVLGGRDTPGFVEYSQDVLAGWIDKYNAK